MTIMWGFILTEWNWVWCTSGKSPPRASNHRQCKDHFSITLSMSVARLPLFLLQLSSSGFRRPYRSSPSCRGQCHCTRGRHVLSSLRKGSWREKGNMYEMPNEKKKLTCNRCSICCRLEQPSAFHILAEAPVILDRTITHISKPFITNLVDNPLQSGRPSIDRARIPDWVSTWRRKPFHTSDSGVASWLDWTPATILVEGKN